MPSLIDRFFRKKPPIIKPIPTENILSNQPEPVDKSQLSSEPRGIPISGRLNASHIETPQIIVGVAQSVGIQRDKNEDSIFTFTANLASYGKNINFGLYIVADGMGGHNFGELASNIAVRKLASYVINTFYLPSIISTDSQPNLSIQEIMHTGVLKAHQAIKEQAIGGGTTLTAALILGDTLTIAHVGDSRAYRIGQDGQMHLLTHDHSVVKRLEEIGQLSPAEASMHPRRNLLYRAVGQGEPFEADIASTQIKQGDELVLCSDGLWGVVPEDKIVASIRSIPEPQQACQSLIELANAAGGPDNISVILIRLTT